MHLFVAVPTHSRMLVEETAFTLLAAQEIALKRGWTFSVRCFYGAVISDIRNAIASMFLESGADLLLMIDADQSIARDDLARMVDFEKPVVGCIYPKRKFNWSGMNPEGFTTIEQVLYGAMEFAGSLEFDEQGQAQAMNGFAKAAYVGTGIMLVRREAFEKLMARFPELQGLGFDESEYPGSSKTNWGFFNHLKLQDQPAFSEDVSFCLRWREAGGEIWADVASNTTHVGRYAFQGNYLDFLKANRQIA